MGSVSTGGAELQPCCWLCYDRVTVNWSANTAVLGSNAIPGKLLAVASWLGLRG